MSKVLFSGQAERLPYSLSRWTDLPGSREKWAWFEAQLDQGYMIAFDPRTAVPGKWSLAPEDTMGLVFWTKDPANLTANAARLKAYPLVIHMTLTGWTEVERGAPNLEKGLDLMKGVVDAFGPDRVVWRFSPVPTVPDVVDRFAKIARAAEAMGIKEVFTAFLQENDQVPEDRAPVVRREVLKHLSRETKLKVLLCKEDRTLTAQDTHFPVKQGICESGERFRALDLGQAPPREGCGCSLAVDPFTINETCVFGCQFCYAANKELAPKKRNTTKKVRLPLA